MQKPYDRHWRLLRACGKWPWDRRAAEDGYELPSVDADRHCRHPKNSARDKIENSITLQQKSALGIAEVH